MISKNRISLRLLSQEPRDQSSDTNWKTPRGGWIGINANLMIFLSKYVWKMQSVTQNKKLKPNSPWRALELLLFGSSRLWVEARNCFLVEMSKDRKMQVNEMGAIMKCKQEIAQDKNVKQWKTIRKPIANTSNLFRGSSYPPPPWRISTKSAKRITRGLHKTGVPNSHQSNLYTRGISTQ